MVALSPQAKGKIERRFGNLQKRLVALLAYAPAQALLGHELARQNRTVCRTTGLSPDDAWAKASAEQRNALRPAPATRRPVTVIHHPGRQFWVVSEPPKPHANRWSDILAKFSL